MARISNSSPNFDVEITPNFGYVLSKESLACLQETNEIETVSTYVVQYSKSFGQGAEFGPKSRIRWQDAQSEADNPGPCALKYDGVPYVVIGYKVLECHHGREWQENIKQRRKEQRRSGFLQNSNDNKHCEIKGRLHKQSKKRGCPAILTMREIIKYPEFKLAKHTTHERVKAAGLLRAALKDNKSTGERRFYVRLPSKDDHKGHNVGENGGDALHLDKRIIKFIRDTTATGSVQTAAEMKMLVEEFVKVEMFKNATPPSRSNRRFFPENSDIRSHMLRADKSKDPCFDQENLQKFIEEFHNESDQDTFFLRKYSQINSQDSTSLLFIHQSAWQKRLLLKYGQEMTFLDATYKTIEYALPLFFVAVKTNSGYMVVATFVTQDENTSSIQEALQILKEWNQEWTPKYIMTGNSDAEILAVEEVFPDCDVLQCDFHRLQAWEKWASMKDNGVHNMKDHLIAMLNQLARATSLEELDAARTDLETSDVWKNNQHLQDYIQQEWLPKYKRWVWLYRQKQLLVSINTNCGLERQTRAFKDEYLRKKTRFSLCKMVRTVVSHFIPESIKKYKKNNPASERSRRQSKDVPAYLHNRPASVIKQCLEMREAAKEIEESDIKTEGGQLLVRSMSRRTEWYCVCISGEQVPCPSCTCYSWTAQGVPCKHMMAIFKHTSYTWSDLPVEYQASPFLMIDDDWKSPKITHFSDGDDAADDIMDVSVDVNTSDHILNQADTEQLQGQCRQELQLLWDMSYTVTDHAGLTNLMEVLVQARNQLQNDVARNQLQNDVPHTEGVALNEPMSQKTLQNDVARNQLQIDVPHTEGVALNEPMLQNTLQNDVARNQLQNDVPHTEGVALNEPMSQNTLQNDVARNQLQNDVPHTEGVALNEPMLQNTSVKMVGKDRVIHKQRVYPYETKHNREQNS